MKMYNCLLYCFSSAVVLLVDNFHRLASPGELSGTGELDSQRHEALDVLHMLRRETNNSTIAQAGAKVLEGLLNEEGARRAGRGLPAPNEDFTRNNTPENDAPTLREVVERIASVSKAKPPGPGSVASTASNNGGSPTLPAPSKSLTSPQAAGFSMSAPSAVTAPSAATPIVQQQSSFQATRPSAASGLPSVNLDLPPTQSYMSANGLNDSLMGGDDSEDLLRSLGFFEVSNIVPSMGQSVESGNYGSMMGGNNGMATDLSWLDGLGEW